MTGHFICEKVPSDLEEKPGTFIMTKKFRRTRKELTNESENDRSLCKKYRQT